MDTRRALGHRYNQKQAGTVDEMRRSVAQRGASVAGRHQFVAKCETDLEGQLVAQCEEEF